MQSIGRVSELVMELDSSILETPSGESRLGSSPSAPRFFLFFIFFLNLFGIQICFVFGPNIQKYVHRVRTNADGMRRLIHQ